MSIRRNSARHLTSPTLPASHSQAIQSAGTSSDPNGVWSSRPPDFRRQLRPRYEDFRGDGQVPLSVWVRWMEETEYGFLRSRGLSVSLRDERGQFGFPRLDVHVAVAATVELESELVIELLVGELTMKSCEYLFRASALPLATNASSATSASSATNASSEGTTSGGATLAVPTLAATGYFRVACCRFPENQPPYAMLIPDWVLERLGPLT